MNKNYVNLILISLVIIILINLINSFINNNTFCKIFSLDKNNNIVEKFYNNINNEIVNDEINEDIQAIQQDIDTLRLDIDNKINSVQNLYNDTQILNEEVNDAKDEWNNIYREYTQVNNAFEGIPNRKCFKNKTDILDIKKTLMKCAEECENDDNCFSFSHDRNNNDCRLSTVCNYEDGQNIEDKTTKLDYGNTLYVKKNKANTINNFNLNKNRQCNDLCYNDILDNGETRVDNVHICANSCNNNQDCVSFEYIFNPDDDQNNCILRGQCNEDYHIENSETYNCFKGQVNQDNYPIDQINYRTDGRGDNQLDEYSLRDLKRQCTNECRNNYNCNGFSYYIDDNNINCDLYNEINYTQTLGSEFKNICILNPDAKKKNLYTHKVRKNSDLDSDKSCDGLCEYSISADTPYIKFYKDSTHKNYDYITFSDMYNIQNLTDFNFENYTHIVVQKGYEAKFFNDNDELLPLNTQNIYSNPPEGANNNNFDFSQEYKIDISELLNSNINKITIHKLNNINCNLYTTNCVGNTRRPELYYDTTGNDLNYCRNQPGNQIPDDEPC
tara:strand:+ start:274 stop:1944 length:1671 start_codon:yes stop_codon:yes gene_type:complete